MTSPKNGPFQQVYFWHHLTILVLGGGRVYVPPGDVGREPEVLVPEPRGEVVERRRHRGRGSLRAHRSLVARVEIILLPRQEMEVCCYSHQKK